MNYFTAREILAGIAFSLWAASIFAFWGSDKTYGDIAANVLTDIPFAVFLALYIEHLNKTERRKANRGRRRAVALAVQKFFQTYQSILHALINDGVESASPSSLPSIDAVRKMAATKGGTTEVSAGVWQQPSPYFAFFLCEYTGATDAKVYPRRPTHRYLAHLGDNIERYYREIFGIDNDVIPDSVVDALTYLKDHHLTMMIQHLGSHHPIRIGFWAEAEVDQIGAQLTILADFFSSELKLSRWSAEDSLRNMVIQALGMRGIASNQP